MAGIVEKTYSDALFQAVSEAGETQLVTVKDELCAVSEILHGCPDFIKLVNTPTIPLEEKLSVAAEAFSGKVSELTYNFLRLLIENGRLSYFAKIEKGYRKLFNEHFDNAEIVVTSSAELTEEQLGKISAKMHEILNKNIIMTAKVDKALIGGVVVDYGDRRFDGSVKTRLETLKQSLSELIG